MKRTLIALGVVAASAAPVVASAAPTVYGKLNLSVEEVQDNTRHGSVTVLNSNVSRIGVKGESELTASLSAIYGIEWGVSGDGNQTDLAQRNRFVGLKSQDLGAIKLGKYDSYLKSIGQNIDQFADLSADNQNVLTGKNRLNNVIGYESPKIADAVNFNVLVQPGEESVAKNSTGTECNGTAVRTCDDHSLVNSASTSIVVTPIDSVTVALGYDWHVQSNFAAFAGNNTGTGTASSYSPPSSLNSTGPVFNYTGSAITGTSGLVVGSGSSQGSANSLYTDKTNTLRLVGSFNDKEAGLSINGLIQSAQRVNGDTITVTGLGTFTDVKPKETGFLVNAAYKFAEGWTGKLQFDRSVTKLSGVDGASDIKLSQITAGIDYNFTSNTKVYTFYNYFQGKNNNNDLTALKGAIGDTVTRKYAAVGIDHKF